MYVSVKMQHRNQRVTTTKAMLLQVQLPRQGLRLNVKADPVLMAHNGTLTPADLPDQGIKA